MASVNPLLTPLGQQETVRDYKHASRTFVDNNYELQPRHANLFHVVFEFTPEATRLFNTVEKLELPILVKSTTLPTFAVDVQTHNQYNRQVHSHHKIQYGPVSMRFHDDVKELVRNLWHKYYTFYSNDPRYAVNSGSYSPYDRYSNRSGQQWGMQQGNKRFFKAIKIYSMHQKKFAEYTLINPIIQSFDHDSHDYSNTGLMEHRMTVQYETVKYATGYVNTEFPAGFADLHYDVEISDIAAPNSLDTAFINGQLSSVAGQRPSDLYNQNTIANVLQGTIMDAVSNLPFGPVINNVLGTVATNVLTGQKPTSNILVPVIGAASIKDINKNEVITNVVKGAIQERNRQVVSSQGQSIGNNQFVEQVVSVDRRDVGYAKVIPSTQNSRGNPNTISDVQRNPPKGGYGWGGTL